MIYTIIFILMGFLGLGISIEKHGKPKKGKENVWVTIIALLIQYFLLYKAGLFDSLLALL